MLQLHDAAVRVGARLVRDGAFSTLGFASYETPDMLVFLEHEKFLSAVTSNAAVRCVLAADTLAGALPEHVGLAVVANPRRAFYELQNQLAAEEGFYWTSFASVVAASARVHPAAFVAERDVRIGERVTVEPRAVILPRVVLEDDVTVRAGTVVGSEGFQVSLVDGRPMRVRHGGGVRLRRNAEVQANCCVDRALFGGFTEVGEDTTIDDLTYVAHQVRIGSRCRIGANVTIAGSVRIGDDVWIGPGAAVSSEVRVGDGASVSIGAVVTRDVEPGQRVSGNFAVDHERFIAFMRQIR